MRTYKTLFFLGAVNVLHASLHIFQAIQSFLLFSYATTHKENFIHKIMENPYMGIVWGIVGVTTLYLGYKDYKAHKK